MTRTAIVLFTCLIAAWKIPAEAQGVSTSPDQCLTATERDRLLAMDQQAFDQDLSGSGGGWRGIAAKTGCEIVAADLIRDYRERHASQEAIIYWHEGQLRAIGNDYATAIALFAKSRNPNEVSNDSWNTYVDASIAFLKKDKQALMQARSELAKIQPPPNFVVKDGVFEIPNNSGSPFKMRWPPNIDVVDGLIKCFDKSYRDAYSNSQCRSAPPQ